MSDNGRGIAPIDDLDAQHLKVCYLEGVVVGREFISNGKSFWITDNEDAASDSMHVYTGHLYKEIGW